MAEVFAGLPGRCHGRGRGRWRALALYPPERSRRLFISPSPLVNHASQGGFQPCANRYKIGVTAAKEKAVSGILIRSPGSIRLPGKTPSMRFNSGAFCGPVGGNIEDNVFPLTPPFGDQAHAIGEIHLPVSFRSHIVLLNDHGPLWKRMAVREDKSHSKLYRNLGARTKRNHRRRGKGRRAYGVYEPVSGFG